MNVNQTAQCTTGVRNLSGLSSALLVGLLGLSVGCTSTNRFPLGSLNPPASSTSAQKQQGSWLSGPSKVGSSIADGAKKAVSQSTKAVSGWFGQSNDPSSKVVQGDKTDPVSLSSKAEVTSDVFVANGRLWESTGNQEKALENYLKALEKDPQDVAALANAGRIHFQKKEYRKAVEYFGKAIEQKPNDAGLQNDLGLALSKLGNHTAAAASLSQALALEPNSSRYANNLASVKFEGGDTQGALEVLVGNNTPAVAHFNMAYLHYKHKQHTQAGHHLRQVLSFQSGADTNKATAMAVERAQELLAQLDHASRLRQQAVAGTQISSTGSVRPATATQAAETSGQNVIRPASTGGVKPTQHAASFRISTDTASQQTQSPLKAGVQPQAPQPSVHSQGTSSFALPPR